MACPRVADVATRDQEAWSIRLNIVYNLVTRAWENLSSSVRQNVIVVWYFARDRKTS